MPEDEDEPYSIDDGIEPIKMAPRFRVYWMVNKEPHSCIAQYETIEELRAHRVRLDRVEAVQLRTVSGTTYVPIQQFLKELDAKGG